MTHRADAANPLSRSEVPEPLKPWIGWAIQGGESALCPFLHGVEGSDSHICRWPGILRLALDPRRGKFSQQWRIYQKGWVPLPGSEEHWPLNVRVKNVPAAVVLQDGSPSIFLDEGEQEISGDFAWDTLPASLPISANLGLLDVSLNGKKLSFPTRSEEGELLLQRVSAPSKEVQTQQIMVHRKVRDSIPLVMDTRIELQVSGKNRELSLGPVLPQGFIPMGVESPLPTKLERSGHLSVQVRPGNWTINLSARHLGPVSVLTRPATDALWPEEEIWVLEPQSALRQISVTGISSIDPQQTTLPEEWKHFAAYPMRLGDSLNLIERTRGQPISDSGTLSLSRQWWLDFDGGGWSARDDLTGDLTQVGRLQMSRPLQVGRVSVDQHDRLITQLDGLEGIEVREGKAHLISDSRLEGAVRTLPAAGWNVQVSKLGGVLHLPPGWSLFHATGVDDVSGSWVNRWTLRDFFLILITALAVSKLFGIRSGIVALIGLVLIFPEPGAPQITWLAVLTCTALVRYLPEGKIRIAFSVLTGGSWIVLSLVCVSFVAQHVRQRLYPQLERSEQFESTSYLDREQGLASPTPSDKLDQLVEGVGKSMASINDRPAPPPPKAAKKNAPAVQRQGFEYAEVATQTGEGVPIWSWDSISLSWNGPVDKSQTLHLYLISPGFNLCLALIRTILTLLLLVILSRSALPSRWQNLLGRIRPLMVLLLVAGTVGQGTARASELPRPEILNDLRERLLAAPECSPDCASASRLSVDVQPRQMRIRMEVHAAVSTAVALPGSLEQWTPEHISLDGKSTVGLWRTDDGLLRAQVPAGVHSLLLEGPLPPRDTFQIAMPLHPHFVEAHLQGWTLVGLHEDGLTDGDLQLTKKIGPSTPETASTSLQSGPLPAFVRVERELNLGLNPEVDTKIVRLTPLGSAVVLAVPLLEGESVTTSDLRVVDRKALISMGPQIGETTWHSVLAQVPSFTLVAPSGQSWTEVWRIRVSPLWHVTFQGFPSVSPDQTPAEGRWTEWHPWPGEQIRVALSRPPAVLGKTLTIDKSHLEVLPGTRSSDIILSFHVRSSRGGQHTLTLPDDSVLQSISIDGKVQPIESQNGKIVFPVSPGSETVTLAWREKRGIQNLFRTPAVDFGTTSVNQDISMSMPTNRWILLAGGPRLGPAVLAWGVLGVFLLVSLILGQLKTTPLRTPQWFFLSAGLLQVPIWAAALVVGWLLILGWRDRQSSWRSPLIFNASQILIVLITLGALTVLALSVEQGLLGSPAMQIAGNGSFEYQLHWYADRVGEDLTKAWVLSVPLWIYRVAMLAWALWLALSLLRWFKWGFTAFTTGDIWKKRLKH